MIKPTLNFLSGETCIARDRRPDNAFHQLELACNLPNRLQVDKSCVSPATAHGHGFDQAQNKACSIQNATISSISSSLTPAITTMLILMGAEPLLLGCTHAIEDI